MQFGNDRIGNAKKEESSVADIVVILIGLDSVCGSNDETSVAKSASRKPYEILQKRPADFGFGVLLEVEHEDAVIAKEPIEVNPAEALGKRSALEELEREGLVLIPGQAANRFVIIKPGVLRNERAALGVADFITKTQETTLYCVHCVLSAIDDDPTPA